MELNQFLTSLPQYQQILAAIQPGQRQLVTGMSGSAKTFLLATLLNDLKHPMIIVTDTLYHMNQFADDLSNVVPADRVYEFPVEELIAAEAATSSPQYRAQRVKALHALLADQPAIIVTSVSGIRKMLPQPAEFKQAQLSLAVGQELDLEVLQKQLFQMGYQRQKLVAAPGEFAVRGSIIDIYPLNTEYPVRIDLFDTEVDSLRFFNPGTQSSIENIDDLQVLPATDNIMTEEMRQTGLQNLQTRLKRSLAHMKDQQSQLKLKQHVEPIIKDLAAGVLDNQLLLFSEFMLPQPASLLDYLNGDGLVVLDDYARLKESNQQLVEDENQWAENKLLAGAIFGQQTFSLDFLPQLKSIQQAQLLFSLFQKGLGGIKLNQLTDMPVRPMQKFLGQLPLLKTELSRYQKQAMTVVILVQDKARMAKLAQTLSDFDIDAIETSWDGIVKGRLQLIANHFANGFEIPVAGLALITENEMFKQAVHRHARRPTFSNAEKIKSYTDLKPGDYVVHVDHGIGRYEGMKTMESGGKHQDYMTISYQDNAKLFIPVSQLSKVQKYVSSEDRHPRINKLGGSEWAKTKRKVAQKVEDIADDLIDLYAKRSTEKGFAFPRDDQYQREFEAAFPYRETPDQLKSADEIKHDMEQPHPMDRLLVGDVGYGKTEVALQAAFKAVEAGKQVALLVPTTVLAHQHYETMLNRFQGYPVSVGVLSRFRTAKQIKATLADLADGSLDIIVGTHRLLSKDVHFKDLGLLVVDEEQRFGVKHKERIKELKSNVDVLTLTATPIPRTLNMSMMGVRDLSVIETPPTNRYPIQTYVMEENAGTIRDGIRREIERGGQVFYLHNRVDSIEKTVTMLQQLVPEAKVAYIHGKMNENQLESVLYDFMNNEYNVLVTTTIIETGVDIANANTLFVENADHMGLSQLYQLRGRIGRSSRIAYAYFMYKPNKVLTEVSENRLEAIRDFTELGSGFKIAMRDLSLRGAGNLLGKQQHGFVDSVGYDLYTQMISEAVNKKRGKVKERSDAVIDLDFEAYLPDDYVSDQRQKIEIYKRIHQIQSEDDYTEIQGDLIDRFGDYPEAVGNLLLVGKLKMLADQALIQNIRNFNHQIIITMSLSANDVYDAQGLLKAVAETQFKATLAQDDHHILIRLTPQPHESFHDWLDGLLKLVDNLVQQRLETIQEGDIK